MEQDIIIKEGVHFVGKECVKCGSCVRYVKGGKCVLCIKRRAEEDKETRSKRRKRYYWENREKELAQMREWKKNNKEKIKEYEERTKDKRTEYLKRWYEINKEVKAEYNKIWGENNRERKSITNKLWVQNNPEKVKAKSQRRRAREINAEGNFTDQEWVDLCNYYGNKCLFPDCKNTNLTADHIIPLSKDGTNYISNIQPLCKSCNCKKHTKVIDYRPTHSQQYP